MIKSEKMQKLPERMHKIMNYLKKIKIPGKVVLIIISVLATVWFLVRVIPKPSRATYPCMQASYPFMTGLVIWISTLLGSAFAFKKAKHKFIQARYLATGLFLVLGIAATTVFVANSAKESKAAKGTSLDIWYKPNVPKGVARGFFPGRVAWGHNPNIASWDGKTGFWWDDKFNNQNETDKLFSQTLSLLTNENTDKKSWEFLFNFYNKSKRNKVQGYKTGEKIAIKINMNNVDSHESNNQINANPQLVFSLLTSLINDRWSSTGKYNCC